MTDPRTTAKNYLAAWQSHDLGAIEALLHVDVEFIGPMSNWKGRDAVMASFKPLLPTLLHLEQRRLLADGDGAVAIYDFVCVPPIGSIRMADTLTIEDGRIRQIEMFFDPRPLVEAALAPARTPFNALAALFRRRRTLQEFADYPGHLLADMGFARDWDGSIVRIVNDPKR